MERHTLFTAITRPVMRFGVTIYFFGLNLFGSVMFCFVTKAYLASLIAFVLFHGIGMLVMCIDPRAPELFLGRLQTWKAANQLFFRCNSYEPY